MLYKLVSKSRAGFVCEIETEADIEPVIKEYGTKHTARSIGYHNKEGEKIDFKDYPHYEDLVYYDEEKYYYVEKFEA